jgi:hypothetical protein
MAQKIKLTVSCQICGKILAEIEKDEMISQDDIDMYQQNTVCPDDGNDNVIAVKTLENQ